jgi:HIRAN domain
MTMGFLRRLFGSSRPAPHPNAPSATIPTTGVPERHRFQVPDGIVVLNGKTRTTNSVVRLNGSDPEALFAAAGPKGKELVPTDLRIEGNAVSVYSGETCLGRLPAAIAARFAPIVLDHEARGWRLITWTDVVRPEVSIAEGGSRSGSALVAEVRLPTPRDPLFADAYDASFAFPRKQVMARRDTPEGKAEHDAWAASIPPPKETVIVRVGDATARASRCPWEAFGDGTIESRGIRLKDKMSIWLPFGEVGDDLEAVGARFVEVVGTTHHADHDAPAFAVEQPVLLVSEPENEQDPKAIAVRSADGRLHAGYLTREIASWCRRRGGYTAGLVLWEYRNPARPADRTGLRLLIAPAPITIEPASPRGRKSQSDADPQ